MFFFISEEALCDWTRQDSHHLVQLAVPPPPPAATDCFRLSVALAKELCKGRVGSIAAFKLEWRDRVRVRTTLIPVKAKSKAASVAKAPVVKAKATAKRTPKAPAAKAPPAPAPPPSAKAPPAPAPQPIADTASVARVPKFVRTAPLIKAPTAVTAEPPLLPSSKAGCVGVEIDCHSIIEVERALFEVEGADGVAQANLPAAASSTSASSTADLHPVTATFRRIAGFSNKRVAKKPAGKTHAAHHPSSISSGTD